MNAQTEIKRLYSGLGLVGLFSLIRFWTGSLGQLEKALPKKGKILDLGCGYGILTNYLGISSRQRKVSGLEIDSQKLKICPRGVINVSFIKSDVTKKRIPQAEGIVIADVLHHLGSFQTQEQVIKKCAESLVKKGVLVISEVDDKPFGKLILARLTDFLLYPGEPVFYCYQKKMISLLGKYFKKSKIKVKILKNNPFPHLLYQCKK